MSDKKFIDGRIVGGCSLHAAENPALCVGKTHRWRTVECGGHAGSDRDIEECAVCGRQLNVSCNFDEDFS